MAGPKKRGGISVDFTDVESGGSHLPDGPYLFEVASVEDKEGQESGATYLAWKVKVAEGPYKGTLVYDNTSLSAKALWRLKGMLEAMGEDVQGKLELNLSSYKGKKFWAETANETYQGKQKPRITGYLREAPEGGGSTTSSAPKGPKKGSNVTFDFEGSQMNGVVQGVEGDKVIVLVEVDGTQEEWELTADELTLA